MMKEEVKKFKKSYQAGAEEELRISTCEGNSSRKFSACPDHTFTQNPSASPSEQHPEV